MAGEEGAGCSRSLQCALGSGPLQPTSLLALAKKKKIPIVLAEAGTECACVRLQGCLFSEL